MLGGVEASSIALQHHPTSVFGLGVRQSAGVSVGSNGACRGGSGGAAGRGASRWPSQPAERSPAERLAAARGGSPRGIPRAATTRIESTRWRRDRQEVSASVEPGKKKRPARARRSASVAPVGHTPTTTCRSVTIGQAIGQVSWSTAVRLPAGFVLIQSIRLPRTTAVLARAGSPLGTSGRLARMGRAGPRWVRKAAETACLLAAYLWPFPSIAAVR